MATWQVKVSGAWVTMPAPAHGGMSIADEPIWSSNTGRGATGKMSGDIVAWKKTLDMEFPPLTFEQSQLIRNTLRNAGEFFEVRFRDFSASSWEYATMYTSNLPRTLYSLANGLRYHTGVKIQLVEQ